jgi:hypothetical protein
MGHRATRTMAKTLAACVLAASLAIPGALARAQQPMPVARAKAETSASWHARRGRYFQRNWGVDIVGVRRVSSGSMLRFDYRVVEPGRAAALTDRKSRPYLIDEATRTALAVPAMENIGELRQVAPLEANRTYFIIFGNPGGLVKRGGRVTLVVGNFRAEGMVVD